MDLVISAAGSNSRFNGKIKALVEIDSVPLLRHNLDLIKYYVDNVYIIVRKGMVNQFPVFDESYKVTYVEIEATIGCGDSIRRGLDILKDRISKQALIMWADVYLETACIVTELLLTKNKELNSCLIFPAVMKDKPYVRVLDYNNRVFKVEFSPERKGLHDQCIFKATDTKRLTSLLNANMQDGYPGDSGEYKFLYLLEYMYNIGSPAIVYETDNYVHSFNTEAELKYLLTASIP